MKKRRKLQYWRRPRAQEKMDDGQDSFLDVVSNLVGILIILVMIAGARVRDVASANPEPAQEQAADEKEAVERQKYVEAVEQLEKSRSKLEQARAEAEELNERYVMVEQSADATEQSYREILQTCASIEAELQLEAQNRGDAEKIAYDLKSELYEKEKKRDDLMKEKASLEAAKPKATVLENLPTPISQRVENGREGFFQLKNGRLAHVPLNEFQERIRLSFKNFRGVLETKTVDQTLGPVENFKFHYLIDYYSNRDSDGINYYAEVRYGECVPLNDEIGEPVDVALAGKDSNFFQSLLKYDRRETTITIFVYPDSFQYLRDIKKALFGLDYSLALRPLPDGAPISIAKDGTASSTY